MMHTKFLIATVGILFNLNVGAASYSYDALGRLTRVKLDNGVQLDYNYDAAGNFSTSRTATASLAPTIATVRPGNQQVTISFNPPSSDGGAPIDSYTVTCSPSSGGSSSSVTAAASPITLTGLINHTQYNCSLHANNGVGSSAESPAVIRRVGRVNLVPVFSIILDN